MDFSFLIASERSGSNLITKMMDAHPQICGPSPLHILRVLGMEYYRYGDLDNTQNWNMLLDDVDALLNSDFAKWAKSFTRQELDSLAPVGDLPGLLRQIFEREAEANGKSGLFIKELWTHRYVSFLDWCFPDSKYVYLVRDPRDMALSWRNNPVHPGGVVAGARQWIHDQSNTVVNFRALHDANRAILVRYEDLVAQPEASLKRICDFMGLEFDSAMLAFHNNKLTQDNAAKNELWNNLSKEVMSDNFNKFKKELSADEIAAIEVTCWPLLRYFGYQPASDMKILQATKSDKINALAQIERQKYRPAPQKRVHDQIQTRLKRRDVKFHDLSPKA